MIPVLALLGFVVILVFLIGFFWSIFGERTKESTEEEWIVLVEAEHSHEIHTLKAIIEQEDIPVIVETESPEAGGIPTNITRNVLRVEPAQVQKALNVIRDSEIDTNKFNVREIKNSEQ